MTFAQEAARRGVELRALHARLERIDGHLEVEADAPAEVLRELRGFADDHCPGAFCIRNPIDLHTHVAVGAERRGARPSVWELSGAIRWRTTDAAPSYGRED